MPDSGISGNSFLIKRFTGKTVLSFGGGVMPLHPKLSGNYKRTAIRLQKANLL